MERTNPDPDLRPPTAEEWQEMCDTFCAMTAQIRRMVDIEGFRRDMRRERLSRATHARRALKQNLKRGTL